MLSEWDIHLKSTSFQTHPLGAPLRVVADAGKDMAVGLKHPCPDRLRRPLKPDGSQPFANRFDASGVGSFIAGFRLK